MGNNSSSRQEQFNKHQKMEAEAIRIFNIRINGYSYAHHGNYYDYVEWCRAKYELDCIPKSCQQGPNYREYDQYGNRI